MLPGMDGFKICRMLKFDKSFKHIPVIILTSMAGDYGEDLAREVGADAFMKKPLDPEKLNEKIIELTSQ